MKKYIILSIMILVLIVLSGIAIRELFPKKENISNVRIISTERIKTVVKWKISREDMTPEQTEQCLSSPIEIEYSVTNKGDMRIVAQDDCKMTEEVIRVKAEAKATLFEKAKPYLIGGGIVAILIIIVKVAVIILL